MPVSVLTRLAMIEQGAAPACTHLPAHRADRPTATRQQSSVAAQWNNEDAAFLRTPSNADDADKLNPFHRALRSA
jgi:hypothetical protein